MNLSEIQNALEACDFFKGLEKSLLHEIAGLGRVEVYEPGQYIYRQGESGEWIYIIAEGHVYLERALDLGPRKGSVVVAMLGKGKVLGCWSTLLGKSHKYMCSAACDKRTRAIAVKGSELRAMMLHNAGIGFHVLENLCFTLRERIQGVYGAMERI
ncbi:MAG: cyclic nucleotide-binding domain-containing protein [Desulfatiglandales bacterium]